MGKPYTPTTLGYALLGLLHQLPRSGYDLRKVFETTPMGHFSSSPGTIYPALGRLEEAGLVEEVPQQQVSGRARRSLRLTERGEAALKSWLHKLVTADDIIWRVHVLLLRFAFMSDDLVSNNHRIAFLEGFQTEAIAYLQHLETFYAENGPAMPVEGRLALLNGVEGYRGRVRWVAQALATLRALDT